MIYLFRILRRSLMMKNNVSRYLAYAFGEIILVVIGILIALMINSWWQSKKDKEYEIDVLLQIQSAIEGDFHMIEGIIERSGTRQDGINFLLKAINTKNPTFPDSAIMAAYNKTSMGSTYTYDRSIYESLKVKGLEKIRNDSIRYMITRLYELYQPRASLFIDDYARERGWKTIISELEPLILDFVPKEDENGNYVIEKQPKEGFLQSPELMHILSLNQEDDSHFRFRIRGIRNRLKISNEIIDSELERLAE